MGTTLGDYVLKLQLGFEDHSYANVYSPTSPLTMTTKKRAPKKLSIPQQQYGQGKTVGQVAEALENKYGIVEAFFGMQEDYIVDNFEAAYANGLDSGMSGGQWDVAWDPAPLQPKFRRAISTRQFDGVLRGVPTKASQGGVSHLRKDPFKKGASPRPSFMNTGMYMRSFSAWLEP